ncbi:MAG: hypothetical protein CMH56_14835 [Myxococcales bacterium]|nr:hypothetical protein [Myxococcales bacterium]
MNQKQAAYIGAQLDLKGGDLHGYHKNMFEAATGHDPGRFAGAMMASPFACCRPYAGLARLAGARLGRGIPTGKVKARYSYHTPYGTHQTERRDLNTGKGIFGKFFGRLKASALEKRLNSDPLFRARFEAKVGGKYIPDGRNDGKITVRRFKPNIFGRAIGLAGIHGLAAQTALGGLAQMQQNAANAIKSLVSKNKSSSSSSSADSAVAKLGPGACFEDLVAAFMMDVVKDQQKQAKEKMNELKDLNSQAKSMREKESKGGIGKFFGGLLGGALGLVTGGIVGAQIGSAAGGWLGKALGSSGKVGNGENKSLDDVNDSRQIKMEELKNIMQRLQQMQQALSNVLNAMHQGSMNAVRNIRA